MTQHDQTLSVPPPAFRRKSRSITLTMLVGTAISLSGCLDDEPKLVGSESDCVDTIGDEEGCKAAAAEAEKAHEATAPRYGSQKDCEEQFGPDRCRRVEQDGSSVFMPALTGFLIGRMMSDSSRYAVQPACNNRGEVYTNGCGPVRGGAHVFYNPATSTYAGRYSSGSFQADRAYSSSWTSGKVATAPAGAVGSVARGGFGASAVGEAGG